MTWNAFKTTFAFEREPAREPPIIQHAPKLDPTNSYGQFPVISTESDDKCQGDKCQGTCKVDKLVSLVSQLAASAKDQKEEIVELVAANRIISNSVHTLSNRLPEFARSSDRNLVAQVENTATVQRTRFDTSGAAPKPQRIVKTRQAPQAESARLKIDPKMEGQLPPLWRGTLLSLLKEKQCTMQDTCVICPAPRRKHTTEDCGFLFALTKAGEDWRKLNAARFGPRAKQPTQSQLVAALTCAPCEDCNPIDEFTDLYGVDFDQNMFAVVGSDDRTYNLLDDSDDSLHAWMETQSN